MGAVEGTTREPLRQEIRAWFEQAMKEVRGDRPPGQRISEEQEFADRRLYAELLARDGWSAITWDPRFGGRGLDLREQLLFTEEAVRAEAPDPLSRLGTDIIGPTIAVVGTEAQKERFLPEIRAAREIWCQGFSEPGAGSDLASLRTRATEVDGGWRLNGQKVWTSFGQYADFCFVLARTDPDVPPHKGISAFAVDMRSEGITVRAIEQITGGSDFCEVFYDDVLVPADCLVGGRGDGWKIAMTALGFERSINFMSRQVRLTKQVEDLIALVRRHADAVPSRLKDRLVDVYVRSVELRATIDHHIDALDRGEPAGPDSSASKVFWSETFQSLADLGAELESTVPGLRDPERSDWTDTYLLSRAATIYAGTSEIQRNIVAERGLGLPR